MADWDGFYTLIGGTAGTLIGLIFVVIALGAEHAKSGDADRTRLFVTPIFVYFATLLGVSLVMIPPLAEATRALALGVIGCAGLAYAINLALLLRRLAKPEEANFFWDLMLPISSYALLIFSAAAWTLKAPFADLSGAIAAVILLVAALRKSWTVTLSIASRGKKDVSD
ncbi:hypothetical protein [Methyloceanibacter sp.]|uniref:hypothetical protein n=1 Tax=Methyloceanibacter sp. TaxID=1965321 RepID=UPI002D39F83B|nr:hypothetical protein [Methyloceanibacter sp.]HZP09421.1 hypothetical protein [Methyloceanibacter sp.]